MKEKSKLIYPDNPGVSLVSIDQCGIRERAESIGHHFLCLVIV